MEDGMTLASQLKQKAKSVNSDRLKNAAEAKQVIRERGARQAAIELVRIIRANKLVQKRKFEQGLLIKWLSTGLHLAWEGKDRIYYNPSSNEQRISAKKYLGYIACQHHVLRLNKELESFEICNRALQNRLENLQVYADISFPSVEFDVKSLLSSFKKQNLFFNSFWRVSFRRELVKFEKAAQTNYVAKVKHDSKIAKNELERVKKVIAQIPFDIDILPVTTLADEIRPQIKTFHSLYNSLATSPESFFRLHPRDPKFVGLNYIQLINSREYQFAVARHVLNEMGIYCNVSAPDVIGKFMAAFRVASGENLFYALFEHITDQELIDKFNDYYELLEVKFNEKKRIQLLPIEGKKVDGLILSIFQSVEKLRKILKLLEVDTLQVIQRQISYTPSVRIADLFSTSTYPKVDRLAYDIQWLSSNAGKKFKKEFTKYLDELAGFGKITAKFKVFSVNDGLLIELPSGKEIPCDIEWDSFEKLLAFLEFEIIETTSSGIVRIKWG